MTLEKISKDIKNYISRIDDEVVLGLDEKELYPFKIEKELFNLEIYKLFVPCEFDGYLDDLSEVGDVLRELAKKDLSLAISIFINVLGSLPVWVSGSNAQKKRVAKALSENKRVCFALTEKTTGSDVLNSETVACKISDDQYQISGEKWMINNCANSDLLVTLCRHSNQEGVLATNFFIIEKDLGVEMTPKILTHGVRGASISGFKMKNLNLYSSDMLGRKGYGFQTMMKTLNISRMCCGWLSLGCLERAYDLTKTFTETRALYGRKVRGFAEVEKTLTTVQGTIELLDFFINFASKNVCRGSDTVPLISSISKYIIPKICEALVADLKIILGARHYLRVGEAAFFQKVLRDISLVSLFDGSSHVNLAYISNILKNYAFRSETDEKAYQEVNATLESMEKLSYENISINCTSNEIFISAISCHSFDSISLEVKRYLLDKYESMKKDFAEEILKYPNTLDSTIYFKFSEFYSKLVLISISLLGASKKKFSNDKVKLLINYIFKDDFVLHNLLFDEMSFDEMIRKMAS